jgi:AcrR family transcriptional regulator
MTEMSFQRARSPEQQQLRREAILAAARAMLDERPPADISLRDLSRHVGLSKSNVVRYFPTREAVFLAVLLADWQEWLDALETTLPRPGRRQQRSTRNRGLAEALTGSLAARPRLCDLFVACQPVLERNIPIDTAREFKQTLLGLVTRLATIVRDRSNGDLDDAAAFNFAGMLWLVVAGARPMATPSPVIAEVLRDPGLAPLCVSFDEVVTTTLHALLDGLSGR